MSGVKLIEYSYDLTTWYSDWESSGKGYAKRTWTEEGDRVVYFRATDNAGNIWVYTYDGTNPSAYDLKIDKTSPVAGTYTVSGTTFKGGKHYVTSETAEITLNFTGMSDNLSGLKLFDVYMKKMLIEKLIDEMKDTKDKKEKSLKDIEVTLNAIDDKLLYIDITDDKNKDLTLKLTSNTIIINKNLKAKLNINNGDYIVFKINNKNRYFEVIGIEKSLINNEAYISNKALSNYMGFKKNIYNMVYLNNYDKDENYSFIYKLSLLKDNIINSMTFYSKALYFIIFIALLISYIVINIISLLVVDENNNFIKL